MKEYIITVTCQGKRQVHRSWGYNPSNARNNLKASIGSFSTVKTVEA